MINDLINIIFEYADINDYYHKCNLCKIYKKEPMKVLDILVYQMKLSFILEYLGRSANLVNYSNFEQIINTSDVLPDPSGDYSRYGWVTNSLLIEEFWHKENGNDTFGDRLGYYEFLSKNFIFLEDRTILVCKKCIFDKKKIKID